MNKCLNFEKLYEIRLRTNKPIMVNYGGKYFFLSPLGIKEYADDETLVIGDGVINDIVVKASDYSLYAVSEQICAGFLTIRGGIRLGLSGEIVWDRGVVKTIKNFSSLNIRVPHEIKGCAKRLLNICVTPQIKNTLIISPPGAGKTTLLRDLARLSASSNPPNNILLIDERNELAAVANGIAQLDVGLSTDIISNCSKEYAFESAIRALRPDIIICDELFGEKDLISIEEATLSGVKVFASVHANDYHDIMMKKGFENIVKKRLFSRFVVLSNKHGPGTYDGVYDENFNKINLF
ncbi:MAG: Flp pilus assembly complex ATPase component TadA [Firmicutes bacterium]|nr:Flp pilus assembly complex ATPase component TadA [Bacillota bacterium]